MYALSQIYQGGTFYICLSQSSRCVISWSIINFSNLFVAHALKAVKLSYTWACSGFCQFVLEAALPSFRHSLKDIPLFVQTILCVVKDVQSNHRMICKKINCSLYFCGVGDKSRRLMLCQLASSLTNPFAFIDGLQAVWLSTLSAVVTCSLINDSICVGVYLGLAYMAYAQFAALYALAACHGSVNKLKCSGANNDVEVIVNQLSSALAHV